MASDIVTQHPAGDLTLTLSGGDLQHLLTLLQAVDELLPNSTDTDSARACLKAATDFLNRA